MTPASQVMVLEVGSTSRMGSSRVSDSTISPWCGIWPPTRPVLPPCGTIGVLVSFASLRIAATSATEPGRRTTGVGRDKARALGEIGRLHRRVGDGVLRADDGGEARREGRAARVRFGSDLTRIVHRRTSHVLGAAARASRSLMASPRPWCGIGITAIGARRKRRARADARTGWRRPRSGRRAATG